MQDPPTGACGDLVLGYSECQCTAPNDDYSHDSMHSSSPSRRELADCKGGSMSYAIKNLKDNELYACVAYKCAKATCPEGMISSEDQESCVQPPKCGKGAIPQKNACRCDVDKHWKGDPDNCTCDASNGFVESDGKCVCEKLDSMEFLEINGRCELKKVCKATETWIAFNNDCVCDEGEGGKAYRDQNGECVLKPKPSHPEAQIWDKTENKWICNDASFWVDDPDNPGKCKCKTDYVNMKDGHLDATLTGQCVPIVTCDDYRQTVQLSTNTCVCDDEHHWKGNAPDCTCDGALFNDQCVIEGDYLTFGKYPQATDEKFDPISWMVLKVEPDTSNIHGRILVLSQYVLDSKPFDTNEDALYPTWKESYLRSWLNNTSNNGFLSAAFSDVERNAILEVTNSTPENNGVDGGEDSIDKVFLLNVESARQDFLDNHVRIAKATSYAIKKGVFVSNGSGNYVVDCANLECGAYWWLRSAGFNEECASIVRTGGDISSILVTRRDGGVRPALWLKY